MRFSEKRREGRVPGLLCANDLVRCGESEENRRMMRDVVSGSGRKFSGEIMSLVNYKYLRLE